MTLHRIFSKLRKQNKGQYFMLGFCIGLSVLLVSSFTLMYLGPTVQMLLPEGGDTRKLANLLLGVSIVGCTIFTLYSSSLFFRYKSREYGVLLALGTPKNALKPLLFQELATVAIIGCFVGLVLSVPLSFGIWTLFKAFLVSSHELTYRFGLSGFIVGIAFCCVLALLLFFLGTRFIRKSNVMEILHEGQKTELVKVIPSWTGKLGIILLIAGILLGFFIPNLSIYVLHRSVPEAVNLVFLVSLAGIYLLMLSLVSQNSAGRNKEKYYNNLVSISLMRFRAQSATRNMCVIALLLFSSLFAAFFGMLYSTGTGTPAADKEKAFTLHFPAGEKQITETDILALAENYLMSVKDYQELDAANLVVSYHRTNYEDGKYFTEDAKMAKLCLFFPESGFERLSGMDIQVKSGTYKTITYTDYKENVWDFMDGLYEALNPDTNEALRLSYSGSVEFNALSDMSNPYAYVISDQDFQKMTATLTMQYREKILCFDVAEFEHSYPFAQALQTEYVRHTSSLSDFMGYYDAWEHRTAQKNGETYGYAQSIGLKPDMEKVPYDWKYAPRFTILEQQDFMQQIAIYVMLCLYIFIIMLTSVAIMSYVRSITVATDNKELFTSLTRLGASPAYRRDILKKQLRKIFQYPIITGCAAAWLFSFSMSYFNDMRFTLNEWINLGNILILILGIWGFLYLIYRRAFKKAQRIVDI